MVPTMKHLLALALVGTFVALTPAQSAESVTAKITAVRGSVQAKASGGAWHPAGANTLIAAGGSVRTVRQSRAELRFLNGSTLRLGPNAVFRLQERDQDPLQLVFGKLWMKVTPQPSPLRVRTPSAVAAVLGTELLVSAKADQSTHVTVLEGKVEVEGHLGDKVTLGPGQWVDAEPNKPLQPPTPFDWSTLRKVEHLLKPVSEDVPFDENDEADWP